MKTTETIGDYVPRKGGFPLKVLRYLMENGKSSGCDIQFKIGLNKWADRKGWVYSQRATSNLDNIMTHLENRGLINILPDDFFELTAEGIELVSKCKKR